MSSNSPTQKPQIFTKIQYLNDIFYMQSFPRSTLTLEKETKRLFPDIKNVDEIDFFYLDDDGEMVKVISDGDLQMLNAMLEGSGKPRTKIIVKNNSPLQKGNGGSRSRRNSLNGSQQQQQA